MDTLVNLSWHLSLYLSIADLDASFGLVQHESFSREVCDQIVTYHNRFLGRVILCAYIEMKSAKPQEIL